MNGCFGGLGLVPRLWILEMEMSVCLGITYDFKYCFRMVYSAFHLYVRVTRLSMFVKLQTAAAAQKSGPYSMLVEVGETTSTFNICVSSHV